MADEFSSLVFDLERLGFYRYTDPALLADVKNDAIARGYLYDLRVGRVFGADAQKIAGGLAADFLRTLQPFLAAAGVVLAVGPESEEDSGHWVQLNGQPLLLNEPGRRAPHCWALARACHMTDELLAAAGSDDRTYGVYFAGNLSLVAFLTEPMAERIAACPAVWPPDLPMNVQQMLQTAAEQEESPSAHAAHHSGWMRDWNKRPWNSRGRD